MTAAARRYADRDEAGRALAGLLDRAGVPRPVRQEDRAVVLALPRGGVPVAAPVADVLDAPLDVVVVRKLGVPGYREVAMGAMAVVAGEVCVVDEPQVRRRARAARHDVDDVRREELVELRRREAVYRQGRAPPELEGCVVVLVDDGLATGATMRAAVAAVRRRSPARVVVAAPVGSREACVAVAAVVDDLVCPLRPEPFRAVGEAYTDFAAPDDAEVVALLARHRHGRRRTD